MVFITAGWGGTGTGAVPVIAEIKRVRYTIGVVTKPFTFEGKRQRAC